MNWKKWECKKNQFKKIKRKRKEMSKMCNYETWKFIYNFELNELMNIFCLGFVKIHPELKDYLETEEFFDSFCLLIKRTSSGKISNFTKTIQDEFEENNYLKEDDF